MTSWYDVIVTFCTWMYHLNIVPRTTVKKSVQTKLHEMPISSLIGKTTYKLFPSTVLHFKIGYCKLRLLSYLRLDYVGNMTLLQEMYAFLPLQLYYRTDLKPRPHICLYLPQLSIRKLTLLSSIKTSTIFIQNTYQLVHYFIYMSVHFSNSSTILLFSLSISQEKFVI